ncbi:MAG: hypothetical protein ABFD83_07485 [Armatimonadota bacterium]
MSERLVVLAVTKMLSGMCTAGISLKTDKWIRPVKEFGTILAGDMTYKDRSPIRPFDIVDFSLIKHRPKPPHIEDWTCDFVHSRPIHEGVVSDRLRLLERHSEPESPSHILKAERSLALFEPSNLEVIFSLDSYSGKYDVRARVAGMGDRPIAVTDIKWRALGKTLLDGSDKLTLTSEEIRNRLRVERIFVAVGLSRLHEGRHWPLVVGVHTCPDYDAQVDYKSL